MGHRRHRPQPAGQAVPRLRQALLLLHDDGLHAGPEPGFLHQGLERQPHGVILQLHLFGDLPHGNPLLFQGRGRQFAQPRRHGQSHHQLDRRHGHDLPDQHRRQRRPPPLRAASLAELRPQIRQTRRGSHVRLPHEREEEQHRRHERGEPAALPRAGHGGPRDLRIRQPLPVRGQFRLQRLGELRSRQTLGFLPLGGGRLGDLQRVVLGRHPQDGQQPEDPRIVRSGGQRRLGRALPLPLHRGHGRRIGILLQLELPGQRPEDHHLRQPQRDVGGGQETRRRSRTGTVQRAEHRSRLLHRRPYGHLHAAHLAAFVDGPAGRYALRQYRTCEIARRRPFGRLQQAVQQGLVAEPARHVHLLAQRSGREG